MKPPAIRDQAEEAGAELRPVPGTGSGSSARVIVTRAPPGTFSAVAVPPCARATAWTIASPRPAPECDATSLPPRTKGLNASGSSPPPKPGPAFSILTFATSPDTVASTRISPPVSGP